MQTRHELGQKSEQEASNWLGAQSGWRQIGRNVRCKLGEIDLIFEENRGEGVELVFVEVRARSLEGWVDGVESVDWKKQRALCRAAAWYLAQYRGPATGVRFDILAWNGLRWNHVRNAWIGN